MASRLTDETLQGIICPDSRVTLDNISATYSSYTEAGPLPGVPVADNTADTLRPIISGTQAYDVRGGIVRAGGVGDAEFAFRKNDGVEDADDWRGWGSPDAPVWVDVMYQDSGYVYKAHDCVTDPASQAVLAAHISYTGLNYHVFLSTINGNTAAISSVDIGSTLNDYAVPAACCSLHVQSSGRIVVFYGQGSKYSDDSGATWTVYSEGAWDRCDINPNTSLRMRVFEINGTLCCISNTANNDIMMWASTDLGKTWLQLNSTAFTLCAKFDVATMPDGSAWMTFIDVSGNHKAVQLTSAFEWIGDIAASRAITIDAAASLAGTYGDCAIACDPDGRLYAYGRGEEKVVAWRYIDSSFDVYSTGLLGTGSDAVLFNAIAATTTMGRVALVTDAESVDAGTSGEVDRLMVTMCGGWSTLVADHPGNRQLSPGFRDSGTESSGDDGARHYQAINLPTTAGSSHVAWAAAGAGGAGSITAEGLRVYGKNQMYKHDLPDDLGHAFVLEWQIKVTTATDSGFTPKPGFYVNSVHTSTSTRYNLRVNIHSDEVVVYCHSCGGTVITAAVDTTAAFRIYHLQMTGAGDLLLMHRLPGETVWTLGGTGSPSTTSVGGTSSYVQWGNDTTGPVTQDATWKMVQVRRIADVGTTQLMWVKGQASLVGKPLNSQGSPVPVIGTSAQAAYLHAEGGSSPDQAAYTIAAAHQHPVENMLPSVEPSPSKGWRSTSTAEQTITWDLGSGTTSKSYMGKAIGLYMSGVNFTTCELRYSDNGASWSTAGTLDFTTGLSGLSYTLTGDVVEVGSGGSNAAKYLFAEVLKGAHVVLDTNKNRQISANLSGGWVEGSTTVLPALRLAAVDGTESASGTCKIISKSAACFMYSNSLTTARYWQIKIPASQPICDIGDDAESGYHIGSMVLGEFVAFPTTGADWTESTSPNYAETITRRGNRVRKSLGPSPKRWVMNWDPADRFLDSAAPDYFSPGGGSQQPLAARAEIYEQLRGISERTSSLATAVVAVKHCPTATGVINWSESMMYGFLSGELELQNVFSENDYDAQQAIRCGSIIIDESI